MTRLRILHVLPSVSQRFGGPAVSAVSLSRGLMARGHDVTIAATELATPPQARERANVSSEELAALAELDVRIFSVRPPHRFAYAPTLGTFLAGAATDYDVVHIHSLFLFPQLAAYRAARRAGVPYIVAPCGALDPYMRRRSPVKKRLVDAIWQRRMLDEAAALHYKTAEEAALVSDLAFSAPPVVVPNGIDLGGCMFADGDETVITAIRLKDPQARVVMFHGRIAEKKGIDTLIRAIASMPSEAHVHAAIVGPDDERMVPSLQELAAEAGVGDRIHFVGPLYGRTKFATIAAADIWILPSRSENFAQAALEAMATGAVVVLSSAVNLAFDAEAAGAALVSEPDEGSVTSTLLRALSLSDDGRRQLSTSARAFAARYSWDAVSKQAEAMYANVLGTARDSA